VKSITSNKYVAMAIGLLIIGLGVWIAYQGFKRVA
jgi:hypothetical protein